MYERKFPNKKAQTATEYIIIVAVVIVIALVVVQIMGGFPGIGSGTSKKVTDYKLATSNQIGIDKYYFTDTSALAVIRNNNYEALTVNNLTIAGVPCTNSSPALPLTLNPGQTNTINCTGAFNSNLNDGATPSMTTTFTNPSIGASYTVSSSGSTASNVTVLSPPVVFNATGGNITYSGGYTIHTFTTNGSFNVTSGNTTLEVLVVAGGGSGGWYYGGGGGAGGLIYNSSYPVSVSNISVKVGVGGPDTSDETGSTNGQNSSFGNLIAIGGGGGAHGHPASPVNAKNGGSGGGAACGTEPCTVPAGSGTIGQGYYGGNASAYCGASGGGAGGAASPCAKWSQIPPGGIGINYSISGSTVCYAGGGGGGSDTNIGAQRGLGLCGGGNGEYGTSTNHSPGTNGTGGGGGGGGSVGKAGGSGIVIVRYLT